MPIKTRKYQLSLRTKAGRDSTVRVNLHHIFLVFLAGKTYRTDRNNLAMFFE